MQKVFDNRSLKTLLIIQAGKYNKAEIKPHEWHGDSDAHGIVNFYEGLTTGGICQTLLFADFCLNQGIVFDEIHYQWKTVTNMPTQQMAVIFEKLAMISKLQEKPIGWSNDLKETIEIHYKHYKNNEDTEPIKSGSRTALYIVNQGVLSGFKKDCMATEGVILQAKKWKEIFEKPVNKILVKSELFRKPKTDSVHVWHRIKAENPDLMAGVQGLDLHHPETRLVTCNEKLSKISSEEFNGLVSKIQKHYKWNLVK